MNQIERNELALMTQAMRRFSRRLDNLMQHEADKHLNAAINLIQQAIVERTATGPVTVQRDGPLTRLRKANERSKKP